VLLPVIGTVIRLQVQRSRLKLGPRGARVYDPAPLQEVEALEIGPRGCIGLRGDERILDVHHADHPDTRNVKLVNGLSLLPRLNYDRMQQLYGEHLTVGVAGESVLLDLDAPWPEGDLLLETDGEPLLLQDVLAAPPCVEFSRFCLRLPVGPVGAEVTQALEDLDHGVRGYYASARGTGTVRVGGRLHGAPR
jgi:hypothetical protein